MTKLLPFRRPTPRDTAPADDAALARAMRAGEAGANAVLFDRYGERVERMLYSVLGPDGELEDLLHEVFIRAIEGIHKLSDDERLGAWLVSIAVFTAREWIRKKTRARWFPLFAEPPEREAWGADPHMTAAVRDTFTVLEALPADERVVFSLRYIEGLELEEIALAADMSLSTVKRRLKEAQRRFQNRGKHFPTLASWMTEDP